MERTTLRLPAALQNIRNRSARRAPALVEIDGTHLDPAIAPRRTADALLELLTQLERSAPDVERPQGR
jgi:hypothetical protein